MGAASRLALVIAIVAAFAAARVAWSARQRQIEQERPDHPRVPPALLDGAERTWVLFTTPLCASCGPAVDQLRAADPAARLVVVDATRHPHHARAFSVRTAPTALLADARGDVQARLVGAAAVADYVRRPQ
jgi:hypothetical protein